MEIYKNFNVFLYMYLYEEKFQIFENIYDV